MDQHLVDYTVRNITTGDEEDIRVLELTPDEMLGFPDPVRETVIALIDDAQQTGSHWEANQDRILDLLLPFISDAQLYERDYAKWERKVLGDTEPPILDRYPPEHVSYRVRQLLNEAIDAAIENWQEGYWAEFTEETTVGEVWGNLAGFIESYIELDPDELSVAFMPRVEA